jgi:hypothetical protein
MMRAMQMGFGLVIVVFGLFLLLVTSGILVAGALDIAGIALVFSGLMFWVPGIAWRRTVPWLTALFIPGMLAFAIGAILMYTGRIGLGAWSYLWTILIIALGVAFLAMYVLGPRERWLQWVGAGFSVTGAFLLAVLTAIFSQDTLARSLGALILIGVGLVAALGALRPRHK